MNLTPPPPKKKMLSKTSCKQKHFLIIPIRPVSLQCFLHSQEFHGLSIFIGWWLQVFMNRITTRGGAWVGFFWGGGCWDAVPALKVVSTLILINGVWVSWPTSELASKKKRGEKKREKKDRTFANYCFCFFVFCFFWGRGVGQLPMLHHSCHNHTFHTTTKTFRKKNKQPPKKKKTFMIHITTRRGICAIFINVCM